jgi:aminoglycoside phosphotransferase (APT) family kinase protein
VKGLDYEALGIPTINQAVERYCTATGREGVPDLNWYFAYNLFRLTGIVQGIKKRIVDGTAASAQAEATAARVPALAKSAWHFAQLAGAS